MAGQLLRDLSLAAWVALAIMPVSARAQTRLHVLFESRDCTRPFGAPCVPGRLITIDVERRAITADAVASATFPMVSDPATTADGRFVVWSGTSLTDLVSPELFAVHLESGAETRILSMPGSSPVFTDRVQPRAFAVTPAHELLIVDSHGSRRVGLGCGATIPSVLGLTTMSGDRRLAFVRCPTNPFVGYTFAVDVNTGSRLASIADDALEQAANENGTELFTVSAPPPPSVGHRVRRIDVATGAVLAEHFLEPVLAVLDIHHDPHARRVLVIGAGRVIALDDRTLAEVGRLQRPTGGTSRPPAALDPDLPHLYVAWTGSGAGRTLLQLIDTSTLAVLAEGELPQQLTPAGMVVGPRVTPPTGLTSSVTGRQVRLQWTPTQDAARRTGFLVEAGSGESHADLASYRVAPDQQTLVVENVPGGRYYVRIRAVNGTGAGTPTADIVVTVP